MVSFTAGAGAAASTNVQSGRPITNAQTDDACWHESLQVPVGQCSSIDSAYTALALHSREAHCGTGCSCASRKQPPMPQGATYLSQAPQVHITAMHSSPGAPTAGVEFLHVPIGEVHGRAPVRQLLLAGPIAEGDCAASVQEVALHLAIQVSDHLQDNRTHLWREACTAWSQAPFCHTHG